MHARRKDLTILNRCREFLEESLQLQLKSGKLQERVTSLVAFTRAAGAKSWQFRRAVLQQLPVSGRRPRTG